MDLEKYMKELISDHDFNKDINRQHYSFAHEIIPYVIDNHFAELINSCVNKTVQSFIFKLWNSCSNNSYSQYNALVYPTCSITMLSDEIGLIYFVMPAPRMPTETAYTAIIFLRDKTALSEWQKNYFTLELGLSNSAFWVLGEWFNASHYNHGIFELEPTLENFLRIVIEKGQSKWA